MLHDDTYMKWLIAVPAAVHTQMTGIHTPAFAAYTSYAISYEILIPDSSDAPSKAADDRL